MRLRDSAGDASATTSRPPLSLQWPSSVRVVLRPSKSTFCFGMHKPLKVRDCIPSVVGVSVVRDGGLSGRKKSVKEESSQMKCIQFSYVPPYTTTATAMVVKRKPSRKDKRLQKKLKRLEDELSSDEEEQQPQTKLSQPSKASKQDSSRSAASARLLKAAAESDDNEDEKNDEDSYNSSSSGGAGEDGDVSDAGGESFDEMDGLDEDDDDFLGNEAAKADATESGIGEKDGMADVMARILNQEVKKKAPVLAKRRTALMKDMEKEKRERHRAKEAAEEKRAALNHQLYVPDHKDTERERQLRRIATRGVVALFNAVTKARQAQEDCGDTGAGMLSCFLNFVSFILSSALTPWLYVLFLMRLTSLF